MGVEGRDRRARPAAVERPPPRAAHTVLALPPGLRLEQIADRVGALPGHDRAAFLALAQSGQIRSKYQGDQTSVEGFTWPDTYFVEGMTDQQILQTIVSEFDEHGDAVGLGNALPPRASPRSRPSVVASLVQAEAGTAADAPKVAAVITQPPAAGDAAADRRHPLLRQGWLSAGAHQRRQADRLALQHLPRQRSAAHADHDRDRAVAARAALAPANVPYLFYVTGKDGVTYFATTLAEHEANIQAHGVRGE